MKPLLIFSGYNYRGIIAMCRFLSQNNLTFFIVANGHDDSINLTDYKRNVIFTRKENELSLDLFSSISDIVEEKGKIPETVILPSSEFLNRFLLSHRKELENLNFIIPLVSEELYIRISDKYSFGELCQEYSINIPPELPVVNKSNIPFVAKPRSYFINGKIVTRKPLLVQTEEEYEEFTLKEKTDEYYYQEFVEGESFYLLYYFDAAGNYSVYSQKNLIQQGNGLSMIGAESSDFHNNKVALKLAEIFKGLEFRGLVMFEIKHFNNKLYMIEANPRIWGPSQLILDSGMDLFDCFVRDWGVSDKKSQKKYIYETNVKYFWSGGIFQDQSIGRELSFHNYKKEAFIDEYAVWSKKDLFFKPDTFHLFIKESS